jgi:hypothetical protein
MSNMMPGDNSGAEPDFGGNDELREMAFRAGAAQMREMLARFIEQGGHPVLAQSMRLNWVPSWGDDPGQASIIVDDLWKAL